MQEILSYLSWPIYDIAAIVVGIMVMFFVRSINCPKWQLPLGLALVSGGFIDLLRYIRHMLPQHHIGTVVDIGLVIAAIVAIVILISRSNEKAQRGYAGNADGAYTTTIPREQFGNYLSGRSNARRR